MSDLEHRLAARHRSINFINKNELNRELPEQLMALKHIKPTDVVLELGASIGRNTCIISSILNDSSNLVTIEPNKYERVSLESNRKMNNFKFKIEPNVLSEFPLYSRGWHTYKTPVPESIRVGNITWENLQKKYNLNFNVLVIDNEGNFVDNLRSYPNLLDNITLLSIEHDFNSEEDINYFSNTLKEKGFIMADKFMKDQKYGPGISWKHGIKSDPIFVSVWKKQ